MAIGVKLRVFTLSLHSNLGGLLIKMGRLEQARAHLQQALEQARNTGNRQFQIYTLCHLGRLAVLDGRPSDALRGIREAAQLAQLSNMLPDLLFCLGIYAMVLESRGYGRRTTRTSFTALPGGLPAVRDALVSVAIAALFLVPVFLRS